jgi:glyoxylase-like metal-dependent hydrolase (beta-lactamase superfamily II)
MRNVRVSSGIGAIVAGLALCLAAAGPLQAHEQATQHHASSPDDVFKVQPVAGGVHVLFGRGGNVGFLVGEEAVVVVDAQFKDLGPGIIRQIQKVTDKPIRYLVNTHHHGDHVGGNDSFRPISLIIAHDNVRKRMLAEPQDVIREAPARIEEARKAGNEATVQRLTQMLEAARSVKVEEIPAPVLTFDSEFRVHLAGETVQVWHTPPAHTDGDVVVYFEKANVVHMGDLLFNKVIPYIDARAGGSAKGYLAALDKVLARVPADVKVIAGHGALTDASGIKAFRQYIDDILEAARAAKAAGKSKEAFLSEVDLPAYKGYDGYEQRFKLNCGIAWDDQR